jgi:MFS superfamily sulfate permease-like transporter
MIDFKSIKPNLSSGLVVFFVAIPLCLGIALASGAPLFSGMIAGVIGGIVIGSLSKSPLSVSGPAAGLTAIVFVAIQQIGSYNAFLLAVVLAGVLQLLFGLIRAGIVANFFPSNVIKGMLSGIGIIIILKQIPHLFGYDQDTEGDLYFLQADGDNTFSALLEPLTHIQLGAIIIGLISVAVIYLWDKYRPKQLYFLPGALFAVIIGAAVNYFLTASGHAWALSGKHLVQLPIIHDFAALKKELFFPDFAAIGNKEVWSAAVVIAVVASIETLLSIEAIDKMDPHRRSTPVNRELLAQGTGNILSGLIGGLPVTSVIVRSSANMNAGATSKISAIVHGLLLVVCTLLIPNILNLIPISALAAILLLTGYKLTSVKVYKEMFAKGKYQWVPFVITILAVVFTDLLKGVGIGMAVSIFAILWGNFKVPYKVKTILADGKHTLHLLLSQEISFINKASIKACLADVPNNAHVEIDASHTKYIDYDVLESIREFNEIIAPEKGIQVRLIGFKDAYGIQSSFPVTVTESKE